MAEMKRKNDQNNLNNMQKQKEKSIKIAMYIWLDQYAYVDGSEVPAINDSNVRGSWNY